MCDREWLPTPFLAFAWLEQIGELFDGKNALLLILAHRPRCHAIEQTEVILLFSLGVAQALKGAERTMLIQDKRRWLGASTVSPFVEGLKKRLRSLELSPSLTVWDVPSIPMILPALG